MFFFSSFLLKLIVLHQRPLYATSSNRLSMPTQCFSSESAPLWYHHNLPEDSTAYTPVAQTMLPNIILVYRDTKTMPAQLSCQVMVSSKYFGTSGCQFMCYFAYLPDWFYNHDDRCEKINKCIPPFLLQGTNTPNIPLFLSIFSFDFFFKKTPLPQKLSEI